MLFSNTLEFMSRSLLLGIENTWCYDVARVVSSCIYAVCLHFYCINLSGFKPFYCLFSGVEVTVGYLSSTDLITPELQSIPIHK